MGETWLKSISVSAAIIPLKDILDRPEFWSRRNIICFAVRDAWWEALKDYGREHKDELNTQRLTLEKFSGDWSEAAFRLFHAIRDRICEASGDTSRDYKEHIKYELKSQIGLKKSLKTYTKQELWLITNKALDWALEAGADVRDLLAEHVHVHKE